MVANVQVMDATGGLLGVVSALIESLTGGGGGGSCDILNLDLGPLRLDLLGLVIDLSAIDLDIIAQTGSGKLLGNLLCAVVRPLDSGGPLAAIGNLLGQINRLLG